jgi:[acyl-carrier-protein] S-malonyltransferase
VTNAALAQRSATVIGWVDDQPIPRTLLDDRLAVLRAGKGAAALPAPDTREGRQLVRWTAHVLFTERLCAAWAGQHEVPIGDPIELDALSAIQLGSITAAAWRTHPAVSAVYRTVVDDDIQATRPEMARQWLLRIASGPTPDAASAAEPVSIGWTTLDDLPLALAAAARDTAPQHATRTAPPQQEAAPVASGGAWHVVVVDEVDIRPVAGAPPVRRSGTALRAFARWLDEQRARSVRVAEGFEHPGDPGQPDNTHQH